MANRDCLRFLLWAAFALVLSMMTSSHAAQESDLRKFGRTASTHEVWAFISRSLREPTPRNRLMPDWLEVLGTFYSNPAADESDLQMGFSLFRKTRAEHYGSDLFAIFDRNPRFRTFISRHIVEEAQKLLANFNPHEAPLKENVLMWLPAFLVSEKDTQLIHMLERILAVTLSKNKDTFYRSFLESPLYFLKEKNLDNFIELFEEISPRLYEFLDNQSWYFQVVSLYESIDRGRYTDFDNYAYSMARVLDAGVSAQIDVVIRQLHTLLAKLPSSWGLARNLFALFESAELHRALAKSGRTLLDADRAQLVKLQGQIQEALKNRASICEQASQANEELLRVWAKLVQGAGEFD